MIEGSGNQLTPSICGIKLTFFIFYEYSKFLAELSRNFKRVNFLQPRDQVVSFLSIANTFLLQLRKKIYNYSFIASEIITVDRSDPIHKRRCSNFQS